LKKHKSPGTDQIPAEVIQAGGTAFHSEIHELNSSIWNEEELPQQWKASSIVLTSIFAFIVVPILCL
jgi:hypothetical protein